MERVKNYLKIFAFLSILSFLFHVYYSLSFSELCFFNRGVIFGLLDFVSPIILSILMVSLLFLTVYVFCQSHKQYSIILIPLILGSLGNVFDRLLHSGVCDYIKIKVFIDFPIFNLNDIFISISLLFILFIIINEPAYSDKK